MKSAPPMVAEAGLMLERVGNGRLVTVKFWPLEVPPPGAGLFTVTVVETAFAMSAALMAAVSWVGLMKVVVRAEPFQRTVDTPSMKPVPFTVSVKPGPCASIVVGVIPVLVGAGLVTDKLRALEVPPPGPGVKTLIVCVPAVATVDASTVMRS